MNKRHLSAFYLGLVLAGATPAKTSAKETRESNEADADFLAFLADVEEATGDGFEQWIKTNSPLFDCNHNKPNKPFVVEKNCQDKR